MAQRKPALRAKLKTRQRPLAVPIRRPITPAQRRRAGDDPVVFRSTRDQARLLCDALREYAARLAVASRSKRGLAQSIEALKTSMLAGFLADQIELELRTRGRAKL